MNIDILVNIGIFVSGIVFAISGWLIKVYIDRRKIILIEHRSSKIHAQVPDLENVVLDFTYRGRRITSFHDNTFYIYNRSLDTVMELDLQLNLETDGTILDALFSKAGTSGTRNISKNIPASGKQVIVKADYLNSTPALNGGIELHVFSDQPLSSVEVHGGAQGWATKYRGNIATGHVNILPAKSNVFIGIEGPIGVGKTTLTRLLEKHWNAEFLDENFEEKKPVLADFYSDKVRYAFHTQLFFLLARYQSFYEKRLRTRILVSDYIFEKDRIFAHLNLHGNELEIYDRIYNALKEHAMTPNLVIYLTADLDTLMDRIFKRGRSYEKNMEREYIKRVVQGYENFFLTFDRAPILVLDTTNINLVNNTDDINKVISKIEKALIAQPN